MTGVHDRRQPPPSYVAPKIFMSKSDLEFIMKMATEVPGWDRERVEAWAKEHVEVYPPVLR